PESPVACVGIEAYPRRWPATTARQSVIGLPENELRGFCVGAQTMCYFCSPGDQRCHAGKFNSRQGNTMPSILYDSFDQKTNEVLEYFAEVEDDDPRLILILGYARIHSAIRDLIDQHTARQTNGRKPNLFKTQISSLRRAGVFDAEYYEYLRL